jgi:hypothetical protein
MRHRDRLAALVALLARNRRLWSPPPFRDPDPAWAAEQPALVAALLDLEEPDLDRLNGDPEAARKWLSTWIPDLHELEGLTRLTHAPAFALPGGDLPGFAILRDVPGRKAEQIEAFAAAVGAPVAPWFEACAGKGHLGRRLVAAHGGAATSLELDPRLCRNGEALAGRLRLEQRFIAGDVHAPEHAERFAGRHVVALHACGDLHRRVIDTAAERRAPAIDVAPCCYQKSVAEPYNAMTPTLAGLGLDRGALKLAVTETVTASKREAATAARQQAWKLAFVAWRERVDPVYRPFMPVPSAWWREGFPAVLRRLAEREGRAVPADTDFQAAESEGWRRWSLVRRLQLVRFSFRRSIEMALLCDLACGLEERGYAVRLSEFCARELTPRNVLLSARLL